MEKPNYLENLVALCPDGIIGVDRQGIINLFNQTAERLTGYQAAEVLGRKSINEIYPTPEVARRVKKLLHAPEMGGCQRLDGLEVEVRHRDGNVVPIRLSAVLILEDGREVGSVGFFHDLTRQRALEQELRRLSITDGLTGLFNRRHFHRVLGEEVARSQRYQRPLTLVCFDLDHFKPFNDNLGHQEGDNILRLVGQCAREQLRSQDFAFRIGGDEFMLVLVESGLRQGLVAGERFRQAFNQCWPQALCQSGPDLHPVTLSLGVAQYVKSERPEGLVMRADLAMYEAKRAGGDRAALALDCISQGQEACVN